MSQNPIAPLNPATTSGSDLATKLVNSEHSQLTQYSGASRPSYAQAGTLWLDAATANNLWKLYDGTSDIIIAAFNTSTHRMREGVDEATIASGATTNVLGSAAKFVAVSGTATVSSLGSEPNQIKFVRATGAFTLTHNVTSLILPTGANIIAAANDTFMVISDASGNARVMAYQRASGEALTAPTVSSFDAGTVMGFFQTAAPTGWTKDVNNFNDYAIRIVTGSASNGGSLNFSTVMGYTATQSYTLTTTDIPAHTHGPGTLQTDTDPGHNHSYTDRGDSSFSVQSGGSSAADNTSSNYNTGSAGAHSHSLTLGLTGSTGGGGGHAHNIDMRVRYVDMIRATKD